MADFETAYLLTMGHEGGYANNPADRGGETYRGIARKFWPGWSGWKLVDAAKQQLNFPRSLGENLPLQAQVKAFYRNAFWPQYLADMTNQALANWLFDKSVNMGPAQAVKLLQRALGITDDGKFGPKTAAAVAAGLTRDDADLLDACRAQARAFYTALAERDPSQRQFLKGWLARA